MATVLSGAQVSPSGVPGPAGFRLPRGYISGLTIFNGGADPVNDLGVGEGECRDDTNTADIRLSVGFVKQVDAPWTAGTNVGGRDTGTAANGTWHFFVIAKADGTSDALLSLSYSAPTLPTGYIYKRRVGSIIRPAGVFAVFVHRENNYFHYSTPAPDVNNTPHSTGQVVAWPVSVPVLPNGVMVHLSAGASNSVDWASVLVRSPNTNNYTANLNATRGGFRDTLDMIVWASNTSTVLVYIVSAAGASSTSVWFTTLGYFDSREIP